jgi:hypothetical protein
MPSALSECGHLDTLFSPSRSLESRLHCLKYGSHALISFVYFNYLFLSFYCGWKWTILEAHAVVKEKRTGGMLIFAAIKA